MKICRFPFELLLDYQEGRLDDKAAARVRGNIATGCRACSADIVWITNFVPAMHAGYQTSLTAERESISATALQFVHNLMRSPAPESAPIADIPLRHPLSIPDPLASWVAQLIFDSRQSLGNHQLVPARESGRLAVHLIYRVAEIDVDVWQEPRSDSSLSLIGQALPVDGSEALTPSLATLLPYSLTEITATDSSSSRQIDLNKDLNKSVKDLNKGVHDGLLEGLLEDGEFVFERVEAGIYTLFLRIAGRDIFLPDLRLGIEETV